MSRLFEKHRKFLIPQSNLLLDSYRHWLGRDLIPRTGDLEADARDLFSAPFVVLSSGAESDPVLNYANLPALQLWSMDWDAITRMPSRLTAEPVHRARREAFLADVRNNGFVDNYSGIRISGKGDRFEIKNAIVWNLIDAQGTYQGQAATFSSWQMLRDGSLDASISSVRPS